MVFKNFQIWILVSIIFAGLIYLVSIIITEDPLIQYQRDKCRWSLSMSSQSIKGIVKEKFIDKYNHSYPTILVSLGSRHKKFEFTHELSNIYEFVAVGDSLIKKQNSLKIEVHRYGEIDSKEMDYGCLK